VVGFSGGNKYLFPGVSGDAFLQFFHWLGALLTNPRINGVPLTPVRRLIDRAATLVPVPRFSFSYVVDGGHLAAIHFGPVLEAWGSAVETSRERHIRVVARPFRSILAEAPEMYDDLWTGGKCMYKLEPVLADGGELIIHAPHIKEVSHSHGRVLDEIGYHVRDYFTARWETFRHYPLGVVAHSTHVRGIGTCVGGVEKPRVRVVLATGIPQERCLRIGLEYRDPASIRREEWMDREAEGILHVPHAGETLYRLKDPPPWARLDVPPPSGGPA
jgi:nickel-dependent lactate racemase